MRRVGAEVGRVVGVGHVPGVGDSSRPGRGTCRGGCVPPPSPPPALRALLAGGVGTSLGLLPTLASCDGEGLVVSHSLLSS